MMWISRLTLEEWKKETEYRQFTREDEKRKIKIGDVIIICVCVCVFIYFFYSRYPFIIYTVGYNIIII